MSAPDTTGWRHLWSVSSGAFFEIRPGILAAVPSPGAVDNAASARESVGVYTEYARSHGSLRLVVLMDSVMAQDREAREVYRQHQDPRIRCVALVCASIFARALASVFMAFSQPPVPTRMFGTLDDALAWIDLAHPPSHDEPER